MMEPKPSFLSTHATVVIADDDDLVRGLLRAVLRSIGLDVIAEASDGQRAVEIVGKLRPAIVCLDIQMPQMDGLAALAKIRALNRDAIVLMITGASTRGNIEAAVAAGADGVLAKPFNTARITSEIERAVARRSAAKEATA